jgi:hypothetical protein
MSNRREDPDDGQAGRDASWLTGLLDTEAERYSPDGRRIRAAMHEQVGGGRHRAFSRRPVWLSRTRARIVTATLVAAAAVAVIATAEIGQPPSGSSPAAASSKLPPTSRNPVVGSSAQGNGRATQSTVSDHPVPTSAPSTSSSSTPSAGAGVKLVSATGTVNSDSFEYWSEEDISVTLDEPVTALRLTVNVARTALVASTGYWTTYNKTMFDVTVTTQANVVTWVFTLKSGQTLQAGNAGFAVQFNRGPSHNAAADTYALSVTGAGQDAAVQGTVAGAF